jgi:hypothetical protein
MPRICETLSKSICGLIEATLEAVVAIDC